jgi:hypothetical protein
VCSLWERVDPSSPALRTSVSECCFGLRAIVRPEIPSVHIASSPDRGYLLVTTSNGDIHILSGATSDTSDMLYTLRSAGASAAQYLWGDRYIGAKHPAAFVLWDASGPKPNKARVEISGRGILYISKYTGSLAYLTIRNDSLHATLLMTEAERRKSFAEPQSSGFLLQPYPCSSIPDVTQCQECAGLGPCSFVGWRLIGPCGEEPKFLSPFNYPIVFHSRSSEDENFIQVGVHLF